MRSTRLNLSALRNNNFSHVQQMEPVQIRPVSLDTALSRGDVLKLAGVATIGMFPALKAVGTSLLDLFKFTSSRNGAALSRRDALKLIGIAAGVATVGLLPVPKAVGTSLLGPLEFVDGQKRIVFKLGDQERWVIDTSLFAGFPKLKIDRNGDVIRLELIDAKYPGTDLPADMVCELRPDVTGWLMKLKLALGGFESEIPFEEWLAGAEPARSAVNMNMPICELGLASGIVMSGFAQAEFFPNWTLKLNGSKLVKIFGFGTEIVSDSITVSLLNPNEPSIMNKREKKRTLISIEGGKHDRPLDISLSTAEGWRLVSKDNPFDVIYVEASENKVGIIRRALVAKSNDEESKLFFQPSHNLTGSDGKSFGLPLRSARYAVAFDSSDYELALLAQFGKEPVWLHTDGCSLELGDSPKTAEFELVTLNGKVEKLSCMPALLKVFAPLSGAIVEPTPVPEGAHLAFASAMKDSAAKSDAAKVKIMPGGKTIVKLPFRFVVSVVRPEDFLVLRFEFINLTLQTGDGQGARLVRTKGNRSAYIVVHFPPQNIAEEAFYETAPEYGDTTASELEPPPVGSRISGPSRLAFKVPDGVDVIDYNLENLLAWTNYQLSLVPVALPPPPPRVQLPSKSAKIPSLKVSASKLSRRKPDFILRRDAQNNLVLILTGKSPVTDNLTAILPELESLYSERILVTSILPIFIPELRKPKRHETAIETPYRLIISPNRSAGWAHAFEPITKNSRTELWHTRLGVRTDDGSVDEKPNFLKTIRAVWTPDFDDPSLTGGSIDTYDPEPYPGPPEPPENPWDLPFRMSLDFNDRNQIVHLTSDYTIASFEPDPIDVGRLMLTSLGAWMNTRGAWEPPVGYSLEEWRHRATMGRDHYVRVVYKGFLFPFGHRASLIKITERKFQQVPSGLLGGKIAAYLRQRMYIIVRQPVKEYPAPGQPFDGRKMPFRSVRITTLVTPDLDPPEDSDINGFVGREAFWPRVGNKDFKFHLVAEDLDGQTSEFTAPLIFIDNTVAFAGVGGIPNPSEIRGNMNTIRNDYRDDDATSRSRRTVTMRGQKVALAESKDTGDTTLETEEIEFDADIPREDEGVQFDDYASQSDVQVAEELFTQDQPWFYPAVKQAKVRILPIEQLTGRADTPTIKFNDTYIEHGLDSVLNKGEIFAELIDTVALNFGAGNVADKVGGLATPSMNIAGISRILGPVGANSVSDLADVVAGNFNPEEFLSEALNAKILGGILLKHIIEAVTDLSQDLQKVPKFVSKTVEIAEQNREYYEEILERESLPEVVIETTFEWKPRVKSYPDEDNPVFELRGNAEDTLYLRATLIKELDPTSANVAESPYYSIEGVLRNFAVNLIGKTGSLSFIRITVDELKFSAKSGRKAETVVNIASVEFLGALRFVNALQRFLDSTALGEGPSIDVSEEGIAAGYTLGIPDVAFGVMSLQNISLSAKLNIPFSGEPVRFRFAFSEREDPFILTIYLFGGGGFFAIELGADGVEKLEASLEFGANISLDLGVASGGISCMGGIYYSMEVAEGEDDAKATLTGYLRMDGELECLGLFTAFCEFYLGLTYVSEGNKAAGEATLTVGMDFGLWSVSVDLTVRREFAGSPPPTFEEMMSEENWRDYLEAFA